MQACTVDRSIDETLCSFILASCSVFQQTLTLKIQRNVHMTHKFHQNVHATSRNLHINQHKLTLKMLTVRY